MENITLYYNLRSPERQIRQGRFQLLAASFSIIVGYWDTFQFYEGTSLIIPLTGLVIAAFNIPFAVFYKKLSKRYGQKFERLLLQTDGLIMLITGIGYDLSGSIFGPYAYYFLAFIYIVVVPYILLPAKTKRNFIQFNPSEIILRRRLRRINLKWNDIESVSLRNNVVEFKRSDRRKAYKCYIRENEENLPGILDLLDEVKKTNQFKFESEL